MKKSSLYGIAVGLTLFVAGLAWTGFNGRRIQHDFQQIGHRGYASQQATLGAAAVTRIHVDASDVPVIVKTQPDSSTVRVAYFSSKNDKFAVTSANGIISVARATPVKSHFMCLFACIHTPYSIIIYVPAGSDYAYAVTANNEAVTFQNSGTLHTGNVSISASHGTVKLQQLVTNGDITVDGGDGSIALQQVQATGTLKLTSPYADTSLTNVQAKTITDQSDNGSASLDTVTADTLSVNANDGTITLKRLAARNGTLTSNYGSITGSVQGSKNDYALKASSPNGSVKIDGVPHDTSYSSGNNAKKTLTVQAPNGEISLNFEGNQ
ncbi:MAG TPA: DUF4097 family beta strand repeat-containing protein [Candidatus Saccharimonadales bacterium]|nr:DUF4097 family beta strand repeat-containing protein [Candidatus Saccharimonadales bacterium]